MHDKISRKTPIKTANSKKRFKAKGKLGRVQIIPEIEAWIPSKRSEKSLARKVQSLSDNDFQKVAEDLVMAMGGWKDMDTMMIYMRKAGIDIKNATSCLDDMQTHGVPIAKVVELTLT